MRNESELPEGVINADPAGGWDENDDVESRERSDAAALNEPSAESQRDPDADPAGLPDVSEPVDPQRISQSPDSLASDGGRQDETVEDDRPSQGADPDLSLPDEEVR